MIAIVPLILALVGVLCYALSSNAKVQELGLKTYFCGMMALAFSLAGHTVKLF